MQSYVILICIYIYTFRLHHFFGVGSQNPPGEHVVDSENDVMMRIGLGESPNGRMIPAMFSESM